MSRLHRTEPLSTSTSLGVVRPCRSIKLLLVDNDDQFRSALSELLGDYEHPVRAYRTPADLPPLTKLSGFSAVITDYEFEGSEDGLSFTRRFNAVHPAIPIILLTAYFSDHLEHSVAAASYLSLLRKPLRYEDLHRHLHDLTATAPNF